MIEPGNTMKLIYYEFKKLFGMRHLWYLLLLILAFSIGVFCWLYSVDEDEFSELETDTNKAIADLCERYAEDSDAINAIWAEYDASVVDGTDYTDKLGYTRADGEIIPDGEMFFYLRNHIGEYERYHERLDSIISTAEGIMLRYSSVGAEELPTYQYAEHFYDKYCALREKIDYSGPVFVRGWDKLIGYDSSLFSAVDIFIYVYILLSAGVLFLSERKEGCLPIVRTTKHGRLKTSGAKVVVSMISAVLVALAFSAVLFIVCGLTFGYSDGRAPVQAVSSYYDCPYLLNFIEYFLLLTLLRCLCAAVFSGIVTLLSAVTFSSIVTYSAGAVFLTANVVAHFVTFGGDPVKLNLLSMSSSMETLGTYSELLIGSDYHSRLSVGIIFYVLIAVFSGIAAAIFGSRCKIISFGAGKARDAYTKLKAKASSILDRIGEKAAEKRKTPSTLFGWELYKLMPASVIVVVAVLLLASVYSSYGSYSRAVKNAEYNEYISENFFGEYSEEMKTVIVKRREELAYLQSPERRNEILRSFLDGKISKAEYESLLSELDQISLEEALLRKLSIKTSELDFLNRETGITGWIFAEDAVSELIGGGFDVFLFAAVVLIFSRQYVYDGGGVGKRPNTGFPLILSATKHGRRQIFKAKFTSALAVSFIVAVIFTLSEFAVAISMTERFFEFLSAPVASIKAYSAIGDITVGKYLSLAFAFRVFGYVTLAVITTAASYSVRKLPPTLFIVSLLTVLPYLLVYVGVSALKYVDFTAILSGGKLLIRSFESSASLWFAVGLSAAYATIAVAASVWVRQKTGN